MTPLLKTTPPPPFWSTPLFLAFGQPTLFKNPRIIHCRLELRYKKAMTNLFLHGKDVNIVVVAFCNLVMPVQKLQRKNIIPAGIRTPVLRVKAEYP